MKVYGQSHEMIIDCHHSDLREIPNTQEVFAHPTTDQSIIFDLLEYQDVPDNEAAQYAYLLYLS